MDKESFIKLLSEFEGDEISIMIDIGTRLVPAYEVTEASIGGIPVIAIRSCEEAYVKSN